MNGRKIGPGIKSWKCYCYSAKIYLAYLTGWLWDREINDDCTCVCVYKTYENTALWTVMKICKR